MNARRLGLLVALIATVIAAFWPAREDDTGEPEVIGTMAPQDRAVSGRAMPGKPPAVNEGTAPDSAAERFPTARPGNLFPRQTWVPPPPPKPKPKPVPPPAPKPPPLPYAYLGSWLETGRETIFLAQGERILPVHQGETIASKWRLDEVSQEELVFTYLPLDMTQTLRIAP